jgi:hypothetical protein
MKKSNNVIIIGCTIPSLYAAIKIQELGYKVTIIEKKSSVIPISDAPYHNFNLYNDNHKAYINLLKRYDIKGEKITDILSDRIFGMINNVIHRSKLIPNNILMTQTFASLYKHLISDAEVNELNLYDTWFNGLFNVMNALDCINLFTYDLVSHINYYYLSYELLGELYNKLIATFYSKYGKLIYNNEIKNIRYIKKKYYVTTNLHNTFNSDIIFTTISRDNLNTFSFWNSDQRILLNSVCAINASIIDNMVNRLIYTKSEPSSSSVRVLLLNDMHIVYPIFTKKTKYVYIWNNGINNVLVREKIKNMFNDKFIICSESFSKNNMFINYSLEYIDSALVKLIKFS